jgi:CO/xanthine dehydrogenase Mo-binding subunit
MTKNNPHLNEESNMTEAAIAALREHGFSRRQFLKGSGALVVAFSVAEFADRLGIAPDKMLAQGGNTPQTLDSWVAVGSDGFVTVYTGRADMGQGTLTVQAQLAAEELSVPLNRVRMVACDTGMTPDQGTSSGSQCHPVNFNEENLAQACATAREALTAMASTKLGAPASQLAVANGVVSVKSDGSKKASYADLLGGKRFDMTISKTAKRKPPQEWTILGRSVPRLEMTDLFTGRFEHVHNVRVPGMVHGRMVRPPSVGATVANVDESSVAGMPGNVKVVVKKNLVGVVADKPWQALQAAEKLKVTWNPGPPLPSQKDFYNYLRTHPGRRDAYSVNTKDVDAKLQGAASRVKATYLHPYQMHGSMGSSAAVADVRGNNATVWSSTQAVYPLRGTTAMVLGLQPQNVRVIYVRGSGCYGLNGADVVAFDAAVLSQAVGKPVRVQLTRKDEMAWGENYGLPFVIDQQAGLDAQGNIIAWDYETWSASYGNRPGNNAPGNVASGMLLGFMPAGVQPRSPAPDPTNFDNGNNAVPAYVTGRVGGKDNGTGTVASQRVLTHTIVSPFFTGPLRSPARLQNSFASESFFDEIAAHAKQDPVAYRLKHIGDQRLKDVITAAAKQANWDTRPSPKPNASRTGVASGRGMACVLYEGDNGYVGLVAEVDVNQDTGVVTARRIVVAQDVGPISSPDGLRNQLEGGALQGLSRALGEEVTWDDQKITSIDWNTYKTLFVGSNLPVIESVLIDHPESEAMGAGETAITIVAAAVGNAIFDATGVRLREIPFTPERVKAALAAPRGNQTAQI